MRQEAFASLAALTERGEEACQLVWASAALREVNQIPLSPAERAQLARRVESISGPVGERAPSVSTVTGQAIPVDEAVALARSIGQAAEYAFSDTGHPSRVTPDHDQLPPSACKAGNPDGLTARELEVLRLVAAGHSNREIADVLVLSLRTIERHINNLYAKIGARGKADATAYAFRHGLT